MAVISFGVLDPIRNLIYRIGETRAIALVIHADADMAISASTITIYDPDGTAVVTNAAMTRDPEGTAAKKHIVSYNWNTTGRSAGDYTYLAKLTLDSSEVIEVWGELAVLAAVSKWDRYVKRAALWLGETSQAEPQRLLGYPTYRIAVAEAIQAYSDAFPRQKQKDYTLAANDFTYDLPTDWEVGWSKIDSVEYPVDDTVQDRYFLEPFEWFLDELQNRWQFLTYSPAAAEVARMTYRVRHQVDDSAAVAADKDTLPARHFNSICQFAAGQALMLLANRSCQMSGTSASAQVVNYRTKQQEFRQQATEMMKIAREAWSENKSEAAGEMVSWGYLRDHGRIEDW